MIERLSPTTRNVLLAALGIGLLVFFWTVRSVLNPLIAGYFLAYAIHPMVLGLQARMRFSRTAAVNTIFGLFFIVVSLALFGLGMQARRLVIDAPEVARSAEAQLDTFIEEHPAIVSWLIEMVEEEEPATDGTGAAEEPAGAAQEQPAQPESSEPGVAGEPAPADAKGEHTASNWAELVEQLGESLFKGERAAEAGRVGLRAAGTGWTLLRRLFGTSFEVATFLFLLPLYTWFLLFELGRIHGFVRRYLPRRDRERLSRIGRQIGEVISNFFRGRLLVCLLKGLVVTLGLVVIQVDYAFLIGMGAGFLSLVPFLGPVLAALVAFLVATTNHSFWGAVVSVGVVFAVAEVIEGYVLIPKILGNSLGLHPVVVLISVFVGGAAFGMFGLLVAIPLTAALVILVRELVLPALAQFADEDG